MDTADDSTRYWLADSQIASDGAVILRLSAKDPGHARWGGVRRYQPGFPDYGFWRWVLEHKDRWADTISEEDVSRMRLEYEATLG
jgi:hypothetical protein